MTIEESASTHLTRLHNTTVCEHCCRMLVAPKYRWIEHIQEYLHALGEIVFILGKCFATLYMGGLMLFEAVFPNIAQGRHTYEQEYERYQKEWEEKREEEHKRRVAERSAAEVEETQAYLGSIKTECAHVSDSKYDQSLIDQWAQTVGQRRSSTEDMEVDLQTLRRNAVETENLRMLEMRRNQDRERLHRDISFHSLESHRWRDRFNKAGDDDERERCLREIEAHDREAHNAQAALRNF